MSTVASLGHDDVLEYLAPIAELLARDSISEVMINADLSVFVEEFGRRRQIFGCDLKGADVRAAIRRIARAENTEPSDTNPIINARFGDGSSRICIVLPPASPDGPAISIRKFRPHPFTGAELIRLGCLPETVYTTLAGAIERKENILISGSVGSGKTTLLNVLARAIPLSERVCLLEFPPEIQLDHANQIKLAASDDIDFSTLIKKAVLRLAPDRIILGEVRGEEAFDLLRVLNLGHSGSFATIHADSAEEALYTLASLAATAKANLNPAFVRDQVGRAIDYVVQVAKFGDGQRKVVELVYVKRYDAEANTFEIERLYGEAA